MGIRGSPEAEVEEELVVVFELDDEDEEEEALDKGATLGGT